MAEFIPWNSQPLDEWAKKHAAGKFTDLDGHSTHYIEKGAGEPVILIHGFFYDSYTWYNIRLQHTKAYGLWLPAIC